jgi:thiol-disulfide isomerase/thioredoxin
MNPIVNEVRKSYGRKINFVYVEMSTPAGKQEAKDEGVMGTPTFLMLDRHGERVYMLQGVYPREVLEQQLDAVLAQG